MRKEGYEESVIALATGYSESVDEETRAARAHYRELYHSFSEKIKPEAEKVCEAGGLFVIGTERHESRRIDNQLRGRSGRQGDPGESRFYLSLEDDLMRLFGSERIMGIAGRLPEDQPIDARILSSSIENAQKHLEDQNFSRRKHVIEYDNVMNEQRRIIYSQRREVLDGNDMNEKIIGMIEQTISGAVESVCVAEDKKEWGLADLRNHFYGFLCTDDDFKYTDEELETVSAEDITKMLFDRAMAIYRAKEEKYGSETMREIERVILLSSVDSHWEDHIDAMDDLKSSVGLNAYAQRNPVNEYKIEGADMFDEMIVNIREKTVRNILSFSLQRVESIQREQSSRATNEGFVGDESKAAPKKPVVNKQNKVAPNDPCPCGSGLKYKKCCGLKD
jgi:preprotein translocase subunit SecA